MNPPDVTNAKTEWELVTGRQVSDDDALWYNTVHENIFSTDGGQTYTISTERESPEKPRQVRASRKV